MKKVLAWACIVGGLVLALSGCESDSRTCAERGGTEKSSMVILYYGSNIWMPTQITSCVIPKEGV